MPAIQTVSAPFGNSVCQSGEETPVIQNRLSGGITSAEREAAQARCGEAIVRHMTLRAVALQRHDLTRRDADKSKAERHWLMASEFSRLMVQLMAGNTDAR